MTRMRNLFLAVLCTSSLVAQTVPPEQVQPRARADIGGDLAMAVRGATAEGNATVGSVERLQALRGAATTAAAALPPESLMAARLRTAVEGAATGITAGDRDPVDSLSATLGEIADHLRFAPRREAPTPAAWPAPAPVGDVVIKDYPAYRMVTAPMRSQGDMSAFGKLFRHIQTNDIPMTAPVQMDHAPEVDGEVGKRRGMAFLYEDQARGQAGKAGDVEIVDVPAERWVAIGARGYETQDSVEDLRTTLRTWLLQHAPRYEVAGPMRVMGWNSPSVRGDRRFYEVELPLRLRRDV